MTQKKNSSFEGSAYYALEPESTTNLEDYGNLVGDLAYLQDLADGTAGTLDMSGPGKGCPPGWPLITQGTPNWTFGALTGQDGYVFVCPCYFPPGGFSYEFRIQTQSNRRHTLEIRDLGLSSGGPFSPVGAQLVADYIFVPGEESDEWVCRFNLGPLSSHSAGYPYLVMIKVQGVPTGVTAIAEDYYNFMLYPAPNGGNSESFNVERSTNEYSLLTTTASGATVKDTFPFDEQLFLEDKPIIGSVLTRVNQEQNALFEYLTGAAPGTNLTLNLASSSDTNPTRSAFFDHDEGGDNGYGIHKNLFTFACGNIHENWTMFSDTPQASPVGRNLAGAATNALHDIAGYAPQLNIDGAGALPTTAVLCFINTQTLGAPLNFTARSYSYNSAGVTAGTDTVTVSVQNEGLYYFVFTSPEYNRDVWNRWRIDMQYPAGYPVKVGEVPCFALVGGTCWVAAT